MKNTITYQSVGTLEEAALRNLRQAKATGWRAETIVGEVD